MNSEPPPPWFIIQTLEVGVQGGYDFREVIIWAIVNKNRPQERRNGL